MAKRKSASKAKGKGARRKPELDRLDGLVKLQQRAVDRWTKYAVSAARLSAKGSMSPASWMQEYARLSRGAVDDAADFMRLVFSRGDR